MQLTVHVECKFRAFFITFGTVKQDFTIDLVKQIPTASDLLTQIGRMFGILPLLNYNANGLTVTVTALGGR